MWYFMIIRRIKSVTLLSQGNEDILDHVLACDETYDNCLSLGKPALRRVDVPSLEEFIYCTLLRNFREA